MILISLDANVSIFIIVNIAIAACVACAMGLLGIRLTVEPNASPPVVTTGPNHTADGSNAHRASPSLVAQPLDAESKWNVVLAVLALSD